MYDPGSIKVWTVRMDRKGNAGHLSLMMVAILVSVMALPQVGAQDFDGVLEVSGSGPIVLDGVLDEGYDQDAVLESFVGVDMWATVDDGDLYLFARWQDDSTQFDKDGWHWVNGTGWVSEGFEDEFELMFSIGRSVDDFEKDGCGVTCHQGPPGQGFVHRTTSEEERADLWDWQSSRSGVVGVLDDQYTTEAEAPQEVFDHFPRDGRLYGFSSDATERPFERNWQDLVDGNGTTHIVPRWVPDPSMWTEEGQWDQTVNRSPTGDALNLSLLPDWSSTTMTDSDLSSGRLLQVMGVGPDGAISYIVPTSSGGDGVMTAVYPMDLRIPGYLIREWVTIPTGQDITSSAIHVDGYWNLELSRALDTGDANDVVFKEKENYAFSIGVVDGPGCCSGLQPNRYLLTFPGSGGDGSDPIPVPGLGLLSVVIIGMVGVFRIRFPSS